MSGALPGVPIEIADLRPPDGISLIGELGDQPVAGARLRTIAPGIGEIKRMYVMPPLRRAGFGAAPLAAIERAVRARALHTVTPGPSSRRRTGSMSAPALWRSRTITRAPRQALGRETPRVPARGAGTDGRHQVAVGPAPDLRGALVLASKSTRWSAMSNLMLMHELGVTPCRYRAPLRARGRFGSLSATARAR